MRRSTRFGFTLIELLIVVAIIVLLLAILLPSLSQAREQAKTVKCLSNLRSVNLATLMYLQTYNNQFPLLTDSAESPIDTKLICSWSYGGKTTAPFWKTQTAGAYSFQIQEKPINQFIVPGPIEWDVEESDGSLRRTEVPTARCPSDRESEQRIKYKAGNAGMSCYDDVGTTFQLNLHSIRGTFPYWYSETKDGSLWAPRLFNKMLRDAQDSFVDRFVILLEENMDYAVDSEQRMVGDHGKYSRFSMAFLDGHATNQYADTRNWCDRGWMLINPRWVDPDNSRGLPIRYKDADKNCDPHN